MSPRRLVLTLSVALVLCMTGFMPVPAVLPQLFAAWGMSETAAGWLNGSYFGGYAAGVPLLLTLTDRIDPRRVLLGSLLLCAIAGFGFAWFADGVWTGTCFRVLAGIGFAGVHFPGVKLISDRLEGVAQSRGAAFYISTFSIGSGVSFLSAGLISQYVHWTWAFVATGAGALIGFLMILFMVPAAPRQGPASTGGYMLDLRPVLANRAARRFILAYFGHIWEVFAYRSWSVAFLAFSVSLPWNAGFSGWNLAVLSALMSFAAPPGSMLVAELSRRYHRTNVIAAAALLSVAVGLLLAFAGTAPFVIVYCLMVLYSMTCFSDTASLANGLLAVADAQYRGATLAVYALIGFSAGLLGPFTVGAVMQLAGGRTEPMAWTWAYVTFAAGSLLVAVCLKAGRGSGPAMTQIEP